MLIKQKYNLLSLKNPADRWVILIGYTCFTIYLIFISISNIYDITSSKHINIYSEYWIFIVLAFGLYTLKPISSQLQIKFIHFIIYGTFASLLINGMNVLFSYVFELIKWLSQMIVG